MASIDEPKPDPMAGTRGIVENRLRAIMERADYVRNLIDRADDSKLIRIPNPPPQDLPTP